MNDIITDTNLDLERMRSGIETTRPRKKQSRDNDILRRECKNMLEGGEFTTLQYLYALTRTIETIAIETGDASSSESNEENSDVTLDQGPLCCVCLQVRKQQCCYIPANTQRAMNNALSKSVKQATNAQFVVQELKTAYRFSLKLYLTPIVPFHCLLFIIE